MCKFIIKHFWNEENAEATITPSWVSSSDKNLTPEQEEVKKIAKTIFRDYIKITREKPEILKFKDYVVKLSYKTKKDPDPHRKRMVTDVTLCIDKKFNKKPIIIGIIGFLFLGIIGYFSLAPNSDKEKVIHQTKKVAHKEVKQAIKVVEKHKKKINRFDEKYDFICKISFKKKERQKCYVGFIKNKCQTKNLKLSYNNWLKSENTHNYQCIGINGFKNDFDFNTFIKNKSNKYKIIQFMKGK